MDYWEDEERRRLLICDLQNIMRRTGMAILSRVKGCVFVYVSTLLAFALVDSIIVAWTGYASATWGVSWADYLWPFFGGEFVGLCLLLVWLHGACRTALVWLHGACRTAKVAYRTVKARF